MEQAVLKYSTTENGEVYVNMANGAWKMPELRAVNLDIQMQSELS